MPSLKNKVAVVTGAGSGIGKAIAQGFAADGAIVRVMDMDLARAQSVAEGIQAGGHKATAYQCDISSQAATLSAFKELADDGGIDILVNNAGISHIGTLEQTSNEDMDRIFQVNVKGAYNCLFGCIGHMKSRRAGVILNIASIAGMIGIADRFAYSMSKGAILAMTYSVAKDYLAYNIRCNSISPARIHTPFVDGYLKNNYPGREKEMFEKLSQAQPIGRMGQPQEVGSLATFLCSDEASFITGTNFPLDGGTLNLSV